MPTALITGITGQDGSYLAELLLGKGYEVHGLIRRSSSFNTGRIDHIFDRLHLHYGDMLDASSLRHVLSVARPDEVYNLAGQSHVGTSFDIPVYTAETIHLGALNLLEAVRDYVRTTDDVRYYQASSSELFGDSPAPQGFLTPFRPRSPYAIAKLAAYWQTINYRQAYGLFACNGILFNHESPRRGETFVTRKITRAATRIKLGLQNKLYLGNLQARRDWGYAPEYVDAMWRMLQHDEPGDFVVATGLSHTVQEFAAAAFAALDLDWRQWVVEDRRYHRPTEVDDLRGDPGTINHVLGWHAETGMAALIEKMIAADMRLAEDERAVKCLRGNQTT
jgi:GDPmannose 4,6-dehydratase